MAPRPIGSKTSDPRTSGPGRTSLSVVTIAVHTKKDVGPGLLNRILKDAGIKESKP